MQTPLLGLCSGRRPVARAVCSQQLCCEGACTLCLGFLPHTWADECAGCLLEAWSLQPAREDSAHNHILIICLFLRGSVHPSSCSGTHCAITRVPLCICVHIHMCVHLCLCTCVHASIVCLCVHTCACAITRAPLCTFMCTYTCVHLCRASMCTQACVFPGLCTYVCVITCAPLCTCACTHTCVHLCLCMCVHASTYGCVHMCVHVFLLPL